MARDPDIELMKELLQDKRVWISCGEILKLDLVKDRSVWRALCRSFPERNEVVARMTWEATGPSAGIFGPAQVGDFVLLAMCHSDKDDGEDSAFVIRRLTSSSDKIPTQAQFFHTVIKALSGKKLFLGSDQKILIGKNTDSGAEPAEPLVLGLENRATWSSALAAIASHTHVSSVPGAPTSPPVNAAAFSALKASPVDDGKINSDLAFTEKGT